MIQCEDFFKAISARSVRFFTGVPDSLLVNFCAYLEDHAERHRHIVAANEGNAVALAIGYHMATGDVPMVYMQNSGLGNCVNPLVSLADPEVYKVPMLLLVGWRGEPGVQDEPQHLKQGRITMSQLDALEIPFWVIDADSDLATILDAVFEAIAARNAPVALIVRKNTFGKYKSKKIFRDTSILLRETALEELLKLIDNKDLIISTTGKTSREVFELRTKNGQKQCDFLTVGGMGHASSIALGIAVGQPNRRVVCLDGDGSLLMHMGSMPVIADYRPKCFIHILLNNGAHESVGGQITAARRINFSKLSKAVGYLGYALAEDVPSLRQAWQSLACKVGPVFIEIKIKTGSRHDLGRPTNSPEQNKLAFMESAGA